MMSKQYVLQKWSENLTILENLESILEINFLEKVDGEMDMSEISMKCTVCYMYELEGNTPERACECGAQYHNRCLYDLFVSEFSATVMRRCVDCPICGAVSVNIYYSKAYLCIYAGDVLSGTQDSKTNKILSYFL
jgi:hypothetical protein